MSEVGFKLDKQSANTMISELENGIERYKRALNKNIQQCDMQNAEVVDHMEQIVQNMNREIQTMKSYLDEKRRQLVEEEQ